jgi:predicted transcriptional regulator
MNSLPEPAVSAVSDLELSHLDLRYEGYRLRQPRLEAALLSAIAREGIREPLLGVTRDTTPIVLDGFKRCRCARTLHLHVVPFASWGSDEVAGILKLLRADRQHALSLLEQARFVHALHTERGLSVAEIAQHLGRSKAWVSLRLGLLQELSPVVREALFAGAFPVYSYLYTLRSFRRLKDVTSADLDQFVGALRGHQEGMSIRQIARQLAVSRRTVRQAIAQEGAPPRRPFVPPLDPELVRGLYAQCEGYVQRVWEKLREEQGVDVKYSTLTRWLRQLGISLPPAPRCQRVPDEPGAEMQHDTSPFTIHLANVPTQLQASLIYLRYSKRRYLQFCHAPRHSDRNQNVS